LSNLAKAGLCKRSGARTFARFFSDLELEEDDMVDLNTTYLGLQLKNPLVASASPLSKKVDTVRRLEEAGAAAVVVYSLFEEQITHESL